MERILRERLNGWVDPQSVFTELFASSGTAFWLDGGANAVTGSSHMGAASPTSRVAFASVPWGTVTVRSPDGGQSVEHDGTIFDFLRNETRAAPLDDGGGFGPAWVGWLGYETGAQVTGAPVSVSAYPDAALLFADRIVSFDHAERFVVLTASEGPGADQWMSEIRARIEALGEEQADAPAVRARQELSASWRHDDGSYLELIRRCQDAIVRGDAYQLCLTNTATIAGRIDPLPAYLALRASSPSHHGGFLRFGEFALLSASPEQFLGVSADGLVTTKPIKGTRPRGETSEEDGRLRDELAASDKERAENLMIVDLMRNDLGRIADLGSVVVTSLLDVESYAKVHQLVSTIQARLAPGLSGIDAVEACFPAGSMTGAPKLSAMRILHELEAGPRGIYAGCFGFFALDGSIDLAMVIRSIAIGAESATIGAGGGITALSVPEEELAEAKLKAAALLAAIGVPETNG